MYCTILLLLNIIHCPESRFLDCDPSSTWGSRNFIQLFAFSSTPFASDFRLVDQES